MKLVIKWPKLYVADNNKSNLSIMLKIIYILLASLVRLIGILIIMFAFFFWMQSKYLDINIIFRAIISSIILATGVSIFKFGKRISGIPNTIRRPQLPLRYSLYLRSFKQDSDTEKDTKGNVGTTNIFPYLLFWGFRTQEQQLAKVINQIAPLIAAIKPGELLPMRGAIRYVITKENWGEELSDLIKSATLIVIRLEKTKSLQWEIEYCTRYAIKNNCSEKLVFILPGDILVYDYYYSRKDLFPKGFVDIKDYFTIDNSDTNMDIGIVYFEEDWTAKIKFIDYNAKYIRFPLQKIYTIAFEDIFKRFNVNFPHPGKPVNYITYYFLISHFLTPRHSLAHS